MRRHSKTGRSGPGARPGDVALKQLSPKRAGNAPGRVSFQPMVAWAIPFRQHSDKTARETNTIGPCFAPHRIAGKLDLEFALDGERRKKSCPGHRDRC